MKCRLVLSFIILWCSYWMDISEVLEELHFQLCYRNNNDDNSVTKCELSEEAIKFHQFAILQGILINFLSKLTSFLHVCFYFHWL